MSGTLTSIIVVHSFPKLYYQSINACYTNNMILCYSHICIIINAATTNYLNILLKKHDRCAFVDMVLNVCHGHEVILQKKHKKLTIFDYLAAMRMTIMHIHRGWSEIKFTIISQRCTVHIQGNLINLKLHLYAIPSNTYKLSQ